MDKPLLAITLGDPAGIGPETIVGAWRSAAVRDVCRPFVVGRPEIVRRAVDLLHSPAKVTEIEDPAEARPTVDGIPCLSAGSADALAVPPAMVDPRGGQAAYDCLVAATRLAISGRIDGLVTAPLNKAALSAAGHLYPGHTELLADLCGVAGASMMLYLPPEARAGGPAGLGVVHVTLHMALRDVFSNLSPAAIARCAELASQVMPRLGRLNGPPRIGVCALNPHAGEEGLFGTEEQAIIRPGIERAQAAGLSIDGPWPADTLMARARDGEFDAIVAMYHDQGHIALKLLGMQQAVNITLGLPIVRTSVAHGTAFDRAWRGTAETAGMVSAIRVAGRLARTRGVKIATTNEIDEPVR